MPWADPAWTPEDDELIDQLVGRKRWENYVRAWNAKPWWYKAWSRVYHKTVLFQYRFTGWLPRWIREIPPTDHTCPTCGHGDSDFCGVNGEYERVLSLLGPGEGRRVSPPKLSEEARAARAPRPPEELVGALQDRIHPTSGRLRAAKSVRFRGGR